MAWCRGCFVKTNAFLASLLSIAVLAFSTFVLISSVTHDANVPPSQQNSTDPTTPHSNISQPEPVNETIRQETTTTGSPNLSIPATSVSSISTKTAGEWNVSNGSPQSSSSQPINEGNEPEEKPPLFWNNFQRHEFWKGKSDHFIILMQASSGIGIFAGVLQLGFSWLLICGSNKDLKDRIRLWNLSNFIVLILLVVIILVPLSYNTSSNSFKGISVFWKEICRRIRSIEFNMSTLETIGDSGHNFLLKNLALFYYVLGVDAFLLSLFLIPTLLSCLFYPCRKCCYCCKGNKRGRTDSDLMLFRTSSERSERFY